MRCPAILVLSLIYDRSGVDDDSTVDGESGSWEGEVGFEGGGVLVAEVAILAEGDEELAVDMNVDQGPARGMAQLGVEADADVAEAVSVAGMTVEHGVE